MCKSIIFISFISKSKKIETRKVKFVYKAYVVSISCRHFDILSVSSFKIFGSAVEETLQGHEIFLAILHQGMHQKGYFY
jgi:hypothetical protein